MTQTQLKQNNGSIAADLQALKDKAVAQVREDGIAVVPGYLGVEQCRDYIDRLEAIFADRYSKGIYCGNHEYQVIYNYFMGRPDMFGLLYQDLTDLVMRGLIDDDYVLISPSARNRRLKSDAKTKNVTSGVGWHVDTRFIGNPPVALRPSPSYLSIVALDEIAPANGATAFVRGSHKRYERPMDRNADLPSEVLVTPPGTLVFFDSALWHKVGQPGLGSRWAIFNMFGPWFMKPYYRFNEMFSVEEMEALPPKIRQLLHWDSIPPRDHAESTVTLRRVREKVSHSPD